MCLQIYSNTSTKVIKIQLINYLLHNYATDMKQNHVTTNKMHDHTAQDYFGLQNGLSLLQYTLVNHDNAGSE